MRILRLIITSLLLVPVFAFAQSKFSVMTFNIRLNIASDSSNAWEFRKDMVSSQVRFYDVDVLGIQEGLIGQVNDLKLALPSYEFVGAGREDGKERGEFSGLFINSKQFKILDSGTFWLSQQPAVPGSIGWDAAITRVCTWALLQDNEKKHKCYIFNTHLDHMGRLARVESIKLILSRIDEIARGFPVVLMGDMNSSQNDDPIKTITNRTNKIPLFNSSEISVNGHYGPTGTFNGFTSHELSNDPIDFIFVSENIEVLKHATISESWMGRFSSDHFPVLAKLKFSK